MNSDNFIVNKYDIFLDIDTKKFKYNGSVCIEITIKNKISALEINSKKINIQSIKINDKISNWEKKKDSEILLIEYDFIPNNYQIKSHLII